MRSLDYVILFVADLEPSIAFYRDAIGLPLKLTGDGYAEFATHGTKFGLFQRSKVAELIGSSPAPGGPAGEVVFVVEDVDAEGERLAALGVPVLMPPTDRPWGHRTLHLADPDGHVVELAQEIARSS